jgi:hypothetical protein
VSVLVGLEGDVVRTLQSIKKGIELLDERRAALSAQRDERNGADDGAVGSVDEAANEVERASEPAAR